MVRYATEPDNASKCKFYDSLVKSLALLSSSSFGSSYKHNSTIIILIIIWGGSVGRAKSVNLQIP